MNGIWLTCSCIVALALGLATLFMLGFRVNTTPSMPVGFYHLESRAPKRGDIVSICLEHDRFSELALDRGYLRSGQCTSGTRPLLKRLAGLPGDRVEVGPAGILVNGRLQPCSQARVMDSHERHLSTPALESGTIPANKALVLSDGHTGGFDSRYFGLVDLRALRSAWPVMTFE